MDRRSFLIGAGAAACAAGPALARFPQIQPWSFRLGPIAVPFVLHGEPADAVAFSAMMRNTLYDIATKDVPSVLREDRSGYQVYISRLGRTASAVLAAHGPTGSDGSDAALRAAVADPTRRMAYATVAATAALVRWRAAAIASILEPLARNRREEESVEYPLLFETEGLAYGEALLAMSRTPVVRPQPPDQARRITGWQIAIVARQLDETFAGLANTPLEDHARAIQLSVGYVDTITRGPRRRPDPQEEAATAYAGKLFANASTPLWAALAR